MLYQVVQQNLETFLSRMREDCLDDDPIPNYVEQTFRRYLECGILAHGFARAHCETCGHDFAVAFSCRTRGLCPSCNGRRMAETAAHVIDHVLPRVPIRQVVLTLPQRLRWYLHRDRKVLSGVLRIFLRALQTSVRKHSPDAARDAQIGAVSFVHRAGASLNVHTHFHVTITDGVFSLSESGEAVFFPASELTESVFEQIQDKLRKRILAYFGRHGYLDWDEVEDMQQWGHGGGFSLNGQVKIDEWDRDGQERLLRYCARPAFALDSMARFDEERIVYDFQRPRPDGQCQQVFTPMELLKRLSELIPPPWMHLVRYYGVLAPNAKLRKKVVMSAGPSETIQARLEEAARKMGIEKEKSKKKASISWAMLMARIFESLPLLCPRCHNPMRIISCIMDLDSVSRFLEHLELPTEAPKLHPARPPPQAEFDLVDEVA